ncbi:MAG: TonB-dependent receptor [Proteobacteria bacterium]|nr:TonB-dependent receptor [Pseudomonadota bacterium]
MKYFLIALFGFCLAANAAAHIENDPLETVTVTASRTPLEIGDAGSSISIISKEQIQRRNATNLADLLRGVPGLAVSQQGSLGAITQVRVRGAEANQVLVLIDGVEANDLSQGSEFNFTHLMVSQIERIEIVRGPQSAIWGSDALSGVINIITRPANLMDTQFSGYAEAGSFATVRTGFGIQHGSSRNQLKLSIDYLNSDGTNISRLGNEQDGYKNTTVNLSGTYDAADNIVLSYLLRNTHSTTYFDDIDFFTTGLPTDASFSTESSQTYAGLSMTFNRENISHTLSLARTDTENITSTNSPVNDKSRGNKKQFRYQANLVSGHHIVTGMLEYEREDYQQRGAASFFGDPNKNLSTDTKSIAVEYRYDGDLLDVSLSGRHDNNSEFDDSAAWRATAAWHLGNQSTTLFASVGESVKNPTFTERFGFFDTFTGNPDLRPEESFSWELGLRQSLMNGQINLSLTWFDADLDNEINGFVFDFASGTFTAANAVKKSNRKGAELGFSYTATDRLELAASYTYLDATQADDSGKEITEVRRPIHSGSFSANYTFSKVNLNAAIIYTGNQEDNFFPPFPPFQERVSLDSFTLVNISGTYRLNHKVELTLRLENTLDEKYEEVFGFSSPGFAVHGGVRVTW